MPQLWSYGLCSVYFLPVSFNLKLARWTAKDLRILGTLCYAGYDGLRHACFDETLGLLMARLKDTADDGTILIFGELKAFIDQLAGTFQHSMLISTKYPQNINVKLEYCTDLNGTKVELEILYRGPRCAKQIQGLILSISPCNYEIIMFLYFNKPSHRLGRIPGFSEFLFSPLTRLLN
jgi:hypothetical protein